MLIREKKGTLAECEISNRVVDWLPVEWYETGKRILHKRTQAGTEVSLRFLKEAPNLQQDDVLYDDAKTIIAVLIVPCDVIVIQPETKHQLAAACYEIGNKHLPLFFEADQLLIPYEPPIFHMLSAAGFVVKKELRKLLQPLKTSVAPHLHASESLFSKILKRTASPHANSPA